MKKYFAKLIAVLVSVMMIMSVFTGCDAINGASDVGKNAAVFEGEKIPMNNIVKLYFYNSQYEEEVSSYYIVSMLVGDFSTYYSSYDIQSEVMTSAMKQLRQVCILKKYASENNITLTEEEEAKVKASVESYKKNYNEVVEQVKPTDAELESFLHDNALATKVYYVLTDSFDKSYDEESVKRKSVEGFSVRARKESPSSSDSDLDSDAEVDEDAKETVTYTDEQREEYRTKYTAECEELFKSGKTVAEIVEQYADNEFVYVTSFGTINCSKDYADSESDNYTTYYEAGWKLSKDEYATVLYTNSSNENVSFLLHCTDDDNAEKKQAAIEEIYVSRRSEIFKTKIAELQEKYPEFHVYENVVSVMKLVSTGLVSTEKLAALYGN